MKKTVFISGATGFLGAYVLRELVKEGVSVRASYRQWSDFSMIEDIREKVEWVPCDLLDVSALSEALEGVEEIYHLAAKVSFRKKDAERMIQSNSRTTANIVNLALDKGVRKLLHVSSIAALGRRANEEHIDEKAVWNREGRNSAYAISKFRAEQEVWRGIAEGLNAVIINPSLILGAGPWRSGTPAMFHAVAKGLPAYPAGINGMVDVRDVARIAIRLMQSPIRGERFIVNSENLSYGQLFSMIAEATGATKPSFEMKEWHGRIVARADRFLAFFQRRKPRVDMDYVRNFGKSYFYSNQKIKEALNYRFIPIEQSILDIAAVWKEKKKPPLLGDINHSS